jgi:hypothetical protein
MFVGFHGHSWCSWRQGDWSKAGMAKPASPNQGGSKLLTLDASHRSWRFRPRRGDGLLAPGKRSVARGLRDYSPSALKGRRSIEGAASRPLEGVSLCLCKPGAALRLPPANFRRPFRARGSVTSACALWCGSLLRATESPESRLSAFQYITVIANACTWRTFKPTCRCAKN